MNQDYTDSLLLKIRSLEEKIKEQEELITYLRRRLRDALADLVTSDIFNKP